MLLSSRLFFSLLFMGLISGCSSPPEPLLRVGTNQWPGYETLHLARQLNFFDSNQIKLKELTSATEVLRAFQQRQLDVAALTLDETLLLAQTEKDLRIFLVMDISNGADKVIAGKDIHQLSDLKGKNISVESTALGAYMMYHLLEAAELKVEDISLKSATVDQHFDLMTKGQSDVVITFDPVATSLLHLGYTCLFDSSKIPNKIVDVLVTRQSVIEQQANSLASLVSAQWQALEYMKNTPDDAYQIIVPRLGVSVNQLAESYKALKLPDQAHNLQLLSNTNALSLTATLAELSTVLFDINLIQTKPTIDMLLTDKFVQ